MSKPGLRPIFRPGSPPAKPSPPAPPIARVSYDGTEYAIAIALLYELGVMYFIKGGAYTNWTYLFTIQKGESPELYPASANYDASYAMKFIAASTMPSIVPLFSDDFCSLDPAWLHDGCLSVLGGRGVITPPPGDIFPYALVGPFTPDTVTEARFYNTLPVGESFGLICADRAILDDRWNGFACWHNGSTAFLGEVIGGVNTNVRSVEKPYASGHRFTLRRGVGGANNVELYWHGVLVGDTYQITNPDVLAVNYVGVFSTTEEMAFDNFSVFVTGVNGEHNCLDNYL